ncbi:glycosyltransferase [Bacteroides fluxus]|uniref:Glycosyltransferase, group 1 family protein n=1 Tax=Bacteroides fluxus YIT 12057 TaxID=763034 RepID=F3PVV5_9BACE|nr:glycosyltransferase [Bacteroides fluxus]EGF53277.1 glycosyltransferase, group 1 family protein [Bacteroides fluxus YIT 12057]
MIKKNILFIENSILPSRGGIEKVSDILSQIFEQDGHRCYFAFWHTDNASIQDSKKIKMNLKQPMQVFYNQLSQFIKENDINIIINQGLTQRRIIYTLKTIKREIHNVKIINCLHNTPYFIQYLERPKSIKIQLILIIKTILARQNIYIKEQKQLYKICDYYVVLSPSFISEAINNFHLKDNKKLYAIGNPLVYSNNINIDFIKQKEVIIVARFDENQKNIISALRIWKQVCERITDWSLRIIGYGEAEVLYKQYIQEQKIPNVIFEGKKDNPQIYYQKASIFMMTSHYEGLSVTLIEALTNKCIPIAYQTFSSIKDIIWNGKNGIIIPPYNEQMYVEKIIELMSNNNLMNTYRANAQLTLSKFAHQEIRKRWYQLFD